MSTRSRTTGGGQRARLRLLELLVAGRWIPPLAGLAYFLLARDVLSFRGMSREGLWLVEAVDRVTPWLTASEWSRGVVEQVWEAHAALPPLTVLVVSVGRWLWPQTPTLSVAYTVCALATAGTIPVVWGLGRRAGGFPAAAAAVFSFVFTPRILGGATAVAFAAPATFAFAFAFYCLYRARTSSLWTLAAIMALPAGILFTQTAVLLLPFFVVLILSERDGSPSREPGMLPLASFPFRLLLPLLLGVPLVALLNPIAWFDPGARTWAYLSHFLARPSAQFLYFGELVGGAVRPPLHFGPVLLFVTAPPVVAVLGIAGVLGEMVVAPLARTRFGHLVERFVDLSPDPEAAGPEARETKRWCFAGLAVTLSLPWLLGGPFFGVTDLIALALPFFAVFAGCAVSRLISSSAAALANWQARARWGQRAIVVFGTSLLGAAVFLGPIAESLTAHPVQEAYYSWFIGSTEGALSKRLPRYPRGPVPVVAVQRAVSLTPQPVPIALLPPNAEDQRIVDRYFGDGLVQARPAWTSHVDAKVVILLHDDQNEAYYDGARAFAGTVPTTTTHVLLRDNVRIVTVAKLPDEQLPQ